MKLRSSWLVFAGLLLAVTMSLAQPIPIDVTNFDLVTGLVASSVRGPNNTILPAGCIIQVVLDSLNDGIDPVTPTGLPTGDDYIVTTFPVGEGTLNDPGAYYAGLTAYAPAEAIRTALITGRQFYLRAFNTSTLPIPGGTRYYTSRVGGTTVPVCPSVQGSIIDNWVWGSMDSTGNGPICGITSGITITAPTGNVTLTAGQTVNITWNSAGVTGNVNIDLTRNYPTGTWETLASVPAANGTYTWTVTAPSTTNARFRITSVNNPMLSDTSDVNFTIISAGLTLIRPDGGETFVTGVSEMLRFARVAATGEVTVKVNNNYPAGTWTTVGTTTTDSLAWTPTIASNNARVAVVLTANPAVADTSASNFVVESPRITVVSPNGTESWNINEAYSFQWTFAHITGNVRVDINRNYPTGPWVTIYASTVNDLIEPWTATGPGTTNARIRILSVADPTVGDTSDANFTLVAPTVNVTSPNGGESWVVGTTHDVTWSTSANWFGNVRLELNRAYPTGTWETLFASIPNDGSEAWQVTGPATTTARIRAVSVNDNTVNDMSNADFSIVQPTLQVTAPNATATYYTSEVVNLTWTATNVTGNVRVDLNRNYPSGTWDSLASVAVGTGAYNWTVSGAATNNARFRVMSTSIGDTNDANLVFALPSVAITAPNGGEIWAVGQARDIIWRGSRAFPGNVNIELNRNYPNGTWEMLFANTPNDSLQIWTVTGPAAIAARIRVTSTANATVTDMSDANFSIGRLVVTSNSGNLFVGQTYAVTWADTALTGNVTLKINRNYPTGTWDNIGTAVVSAHTANWTVTGPAATNARFAVVSNTIPGAADTSDGTFVINPAALTLTHPNGGDTLFITRNDTIRWTSTPGIGNVRIQVNRTWPSTTWETIFASTTNDSSQIWLVTPQPTFGARMRIQSVADTTIGDTSNASFFIAPVIAVMSPGARRDTVEVGSNVTIRWNRFGAILPVTVALNRDYPNGTWTNLATGVNADTLVWAVTAPATQGATARIRVYYDVIPLIFDVSDSNFVIRASEAPEANEGLPRVFALKSTYPNPFNSTMNLNLAIPRAAVVTIRAFDVMGREVAVIHNGNLTAGYHNVQWNAPTLASGTYIIRMDAPGFSTTRKVMYLR